MVKFWAATLLTFFLIFLLVSAASAQTPEPTPSPTPSYQQAIPMSTGSTLLLVKSVTYGDIAATTAVLLLVAVELLKAFVTIPHRFMAKK